MANTTFRSIIHIYTSPFFKSIYSRKAPLKHWFQTRLDIIIQVLKNCVYYILYRGNYITQAKRATDTHWLLISSENNKNALSFVDKNLENTSWVSTGTNPINSKDKQLHRLSFHYSLRHKLQYFSNLKKVKNQEGKYSSKIAHKIFLATGIYEASLQLIKKHKPKSIFFANDHNIKNRALLHAAIELGIKTIYIQHAHVTPSFPPLLFGLSLLEGQSSWDTYKQIGDIKSAVHLVGMPKFDPYSKRRNSSATVKRIGICTNLLDSINDIREITELLSTSFPTIEFSYRPHPRDKRNINLSNQIKRSDSKSESVFDFLTKQDAIIAGNSSIHLEASLLNLVSIYYRYSDTGLADDYYGFIENNLIDAAHSKEALVQLIEKVQVNKSTQLFKKANYYNAAVGEEWEGKSSERAMQLIHKYLS